jgi:hypothetical protein
MHNRSNPWASNWFKRYEEEGIEGLQDRTKSGRPFELTEEIEYQTKKELKENNKGWTTKQVEELIVKNGGIKYHYTHYIYAAISFVNRGSNRRCQERYMLIQQYPWRKKRFSKIYRTDTCG